MPTKHILLTRKEYRDATGETRQNVQNKIKRKTLRTMTVKKEKDEERIVLTAEAWAAILAKSQGVKVDGVHDQE